MTSLPANSVAAASPLSHTPDHPFGGLICTTDFEPLDIVPSSQPWLDGDDLGLPLATLAPADPSGGHESHGGGEIGVLHDVAPLAPAGCSLSPRGSRNVLPRRRRLVRRAPPVDPSTVLRVTTNFDTSIPRSHKLVRRVSTTPVKKVIYGDFSSESEAESSPPAPRGAQRKRQAARDAATKILKEIHCLEGITARLRREHNRLCRVAASDLLNDQNSTYDAL
ncbi:hypothetical protein B0H10DRAFT_2444293 [Mycena sp. CBHHK59/15]|nr:hypothetical protein B0H10DRAFT_2444293 [Mycena sp. CBHHK59/15]